MAENNGVTFAGEIVIKSLNIINAKQTNKLDISLMFMEIELYEDIFNNSMSGNITMLDNFNLISGLPINGEELLELEFYSNAFDSKINTISKIFYIYKVSKRLVTNQKKNAYVLHFTTQESLTDSVTKISKAYSGYGHDIVQTIYTENFKEYSATPLIVEKSSNNFKFVSNYWSPFKCMNYAASRSTDTTAYKVPTFLFYESSKSFNFKSLNSLYTQAPYVEINYDKNPRRAEVSTDGGETVRDVQKEYTTAESMTIDYTTDFFFRMASGAYGHRMYEFDALNKTFNFNSYNYTENFKNTNHLDKFPMVSGYIVDAVANASLNTNVSLPFVHNTMKIDNSSDIIMKRLSLLAHTEFYKVELTLPGRTDLEVGTVVKFNMLNYASVDNNMSEANASAIDPIDKYYSGNYLVGAIYHRLTYSRHKMTVQLFKDSFVKEISFSGDIA